MKNIGIYIHIPFCVSKCKYCDFNSYTGVSHKQQDYIYALIEEMKYYSSKCRERCVDTIYIGGGTPSSLFAGAITTIIAELKKSYNVLNNAEITIEANPNTITMDKAIEWRCAGINRVSVGLQTTKASALKTIGRSHTKKDYINAIKTLHDAGFNNINTDLMIGLPKQKSSDVKYAINLCYKLGTTHVSCYSLILEPDTPLNQMVEDGVVKLPKEEKTLGMYVTAHNTLNKLGYNKYEVSNFAKTSYECKHNLNCWSMQEYIGFGAGAHSFVNNIRYSNEIKIDKYIKDIKDNNMAVVESEKCSNLDLYEEALMLGLRKTDGVAISLLDKYLGESFLDKYKSTLDKLINNNLIIINSNNLKVTEKGMYILNQIILELVI